MLFEFTWLFFFFFQAEDGIRDAQESRGLGDVYKRQVRSSPTLPVRMPTGPNARDANAKDHDHRLRWKWKVHIRRSTQQAPDDPCLPSGSTVLEARLGRNTTSRVDIDTGVPLQARCVDYGLSLIHI